MNKTVAPPRRILRLAEVRQRIGVGRTTLDEQFIKTGKLRKIKLGKRAVGILESEWKRCSTSCLRRNEGADTM